MMEKQTMRRLLTAVALIIVAGPAAHAACKDEVASALERQRKTSGFRMQTKMLSEQGLVDMTVDYMLPDRMRQVVKLDDRAQAGRDDRRRPRCLEPPRGRGLAPAAPADRRRAGGPDAGDAGR